MPDVPHSEERHGGAAAAARVLLVEDEPRLRDTIAEALGGAGLGVAAGADTSTAEAALGAAQADPAGPPPAVLVADTEPAPGRGMDAFALAEEARRRWPGLGVVFVTGRRRPSRLDGQVLRARDRFLPKPVRPDALVRTVRGLLGGPGRR
jgi:DNA-binding response OmpR family regulator